ncbi:MAG TPA: hypothetical protein VLT45_02640 [Kofleriaceae bacterium]|nr:hypothetical protein [Kofleriaceae bacterium]
MKFSLALLLPLAVGCSTSQPQVLTGRVAPGFPSAVSSVEVLKGTSVIATAPVAADGSFRLSVPAGTGYAVRLVGTGTTGLVFPRHASGVQHTFAIRSGGVAFDLGKVFYIGNASTTTFAFHDAGTGGSCDGEDHDSSGATCVDDGDQSGGTCGTESETADGSGDGSDAAEAPDAGDAVAEHNFPADGCADGGDNGGDDSGSDASGSDAGGSGA